MISEFFHTILHPETLIMTLGTLGVIAIVFVETGLFVGFFLPGDSLLFTAGYLATQGYVSLPILLVGAFIAAVLGDSVGYAFGKNVGPAIFNKEDSTFFNKKHIVRAQNFYEIHGKKTIILARFVPIIRTFAPVVAGIGNMRYKTFLTFNIVGAFVWTWGALLLGYGFGSFIPNPDRYIIPTVIFIAVVTSLPALKEIFKEGLRRWREVEK
jgi:membrane-associated protein